MYKTLPKLLFCIFFSSLCAYGASPGTTRTECMFALSKADELYDSAKQRLVLAKSTFESINQNIRKNGHEPELCNSLYDLKIDFAALVDDFESCRGFYLDATKVCQSQYFKKIGMRISESCIVSRKMATGYFLTVDRLLSSRCK